MRAFWVVIVVSGLVWLAVKVYPFAADCVADWWKPEPPPELTTQQTKLARAEPYIHPFAHILPAETLVFCWSGSLDRVIPSLLGSEEAAAEIQARSPTYARLVHALGADLSSLFDLERLGVDTRGQPAFAIAPVAPSHFARIVYVPVLANVDAVEVVKLFADKQFGNAVSYDTVEIAGGDALFLWRTDDFPEHPMYNLVFGLPGALVWVFPDRMGRISGPDWKTGLSNLGARLMDSQRPKLSSQSALAECSRGAETALLTAYINPAGTRLIFPDDGSWWSSLAGIAQTGAVSYSVNRGPAGFDVIVRKNFHSDARLEGPQVRRTQFLRHLPEKPAVFAHVSWDAELAKSVERGGARVTDSPDGSFKVAIELLGFLRGLDAGFDGPGLSGDVGFYIGSWGDSLESTLQHAVIFMGLSETMTVAALLKHLKSRISSRESALSKIVSVIATSQGSSSLFQMTYLGQKLWCKIMERTVWCSPTEHALESLRISTQEAGGIMFSKDLDELLFSRSAIVAYVDGPRTVEALQNVVEPPVFDMLRPYWPAIVSIGDISLRSFSAGEAVISEISITFRDEAAMATVLDHLRNWGALTLEQHLARQQFEQRAPQY